MKKRVLITIDQDIHEYYQKMLKENGMPFSSFVNVILTKMSASNFVTNLSSSMEIK